MKTYITVAILFILSLQSCDDVLDVEMRQFVDTEEVYLTEENIPNVLNGAYAGLKGTFGNNEGGELYGGGFTLISELMAGTDEVVWQGSFDTYREVYEKDITVTNTMIRNNWIRAYDVVNTVNNILANLDLVSSQEDRNSYEGQALALRGIIFFELTRFWGKPHSAGNTDSNLGIPLILDPTLTIGEALNTSRFERKTVAQCYNQIISDLTAAKNLLSEDLGKNGIYISTYTVSAFLSRVYLMQSEFELAAAEASRVIESGLYPLGDDPLKVFNTTANIDEDIFTIQLTALSNSGTSNSGLATHFARLFGSGRGDVQVTEAHFAKYEEGDLRAGIDSTLTSISAAGSPSQMFYEGVGGQNSGGIQCGKYQDSERNIQIIRIPEMYLTRAEANFEAGTTLGDTPLNDINAVRARAGLAPLTAIIDVQEIRDERIKELAFEGHLLHDYKRWQVSIGEFSFDADNLVLPIPERETDLYDIPQNDGY